ncbi:transcriptional regulator, DeoR family [Clostridium amylolyticum]|uniref:Transcriptional regulator, DeoR family n=1 Tax=Clostridium amylolyticum TaxID=1121298 RepID=A0A1M6GR14_9CLOT|nr:DeoR/GlpR family DNA-binding transcription regulator [Clostridium amylolyticum]SHJ12338.1 transcriptional regulator, DeoR family [Clostridium amylolyticum]
MFAEERWEEINKILKKEGKIKVKDLSSRFNVTEDCIRKDLKHLENQGFLKKIYGGAVKVRDSLHESDILVRKEMDIPAKNLIAQKAFDIIQDRSIIFLDISTTNIILAKLLSESTKNVTLITNMIEAIHVLSKNHNLTVVLTGGVLNKQMDGFTGASTIELISKYKFDMSFLGSCGLDVYDKSITTFDIEDGITKKAIIEASKKSYLVMENKKFNSDGNYKFAKIDDIDAIITEKLPDTETLSVLEDYKIQVI